MSSEPSTPIPTVVRVTELEQGDGPLVFGRLHRGDSWKALDGPHDKCSGRQVVFGPGLRPEDGTTGTLIRCSGCRRSYVLDTGSFSAGRK